MGNEDLMKERKLALGMSDDEVKAGHIAGLAWLWFESWKDVEQMECD